METTIERSELRTVFSSYKSWLIASLFLSLLGWTTAIVTTSYMAVATIAYSFLLCGIIFRSKKKIHIPFMLAGVILDCTLVLILEIQRSAIASALGGTLNLYQKGHILFSSLAVALYIPTIIFGTRTILKSPNEVKRKTHRYLGRIAFLCRTGGFFLMFSLLEHVKK